MKSGDIFDCMTWGNGIIIGIWWVKARDAAEHPTMYRTAPKTKNHLAKKVKCQGQETLG